MTIRVGVCCYMIKLDQTDFDSRISVSENIYSIIKKNINNWNLKPMQRISEKEMSESLKVSRTPVRESFIRLSEEGFLDILSQRGTFVSKINLKDVEEGLFIRTNLEVAVLKLALHVLTDKNIEMLKRCILKQENAIINKDYVEFLVYDELFHSEIFTGCGMFKTWRVIKSSTVQYSRLRMLTIISIDKYKTLINEHRQILKCIVNRDEDAVDSVIRKHVEQLFFEETVLREKYPDYFI